MQPGSLTIKFFNPLQKNSDKYWSVYLYNSEYEELCYTGIDGNKTSTESLTTGVPAGTYYIRVNSDDQYSAKLTDMYTLAADFLASDLWEKEFNEEFTTATNIELNTEYNGSCRSGYRYEKDYFKFQIPESGFVSVVFSNPLQENSGKYWSVYLYNSEYQLVCDEFVYGNKTTVNLASTGVASGTYYIRVDSSSEYQAASSDVYSIRANFMPSSVWEKELNEDFTSATDINLEAEYYGTT